jgi:hypothetical protein
MCTAHFAGGDKTTSVLPPKLDPVVQGELPGRNSVGDALFASLAPAAPAAPRAGPQRGSDTVPMDEYERVCDELHAARELAASTAKARGRSRAALRQGSWAWLLSSHKHAATFSGATVAELEAAMDLLTSAGAGAVYNAEHPDHRDPGWQTRRGRKPMRHIEFEDACALLLHRLFTERRLQVLELYTGWDKRAIAVYANTAATIWSSIAEETLLRKLDPGVMEAARTQMLGKGSQFGPGGERGPMSLQIDGFKTSVQYTSNPVTHQLVHSAYVNDACA